MASSKRARIVTLVWATIQHAVIHRLANSPPGLCVIQVVQLAVRVIASLRRKRSYAGNPRTTDVIRPSFAPVTRQRVQRISLSRTVRTHDPHNPGCSNNSSRSKLWDWRASMCRWCLYIVGLYAPFALRAFALLELTILQRNASRQDPRSG